MDKILEEFIEYAKHHPDRFWRSLRNFSGHDYVFLGNLSSAKGGEAVKIGGLKVYVKDTYEFGGKES